MPHGNLNRTLTLGALGATLFLGPAGIPLLIAQCIRMQKMSTDDMAERVADQLADADDGLLQEVERSRPDVNDACVTHEFPLNNDAVFPIFMKGTSQTVVDFRTGRKATRAWSGIGLPDPISREEKPSLSDESSDAARSYLDGIRSFRSEHGFTPEEDNES